MTRKCVLLRVGVDAASGGIQGPLFEDGTFELICIPDKKRVGADTYGNRIGRNGRPLVDYFPLSRRTALASQPFHDDPEFRTFTYGDPTAPKRSLRNLESGDFLAFYCGLQAWDDTRGWIQGQRPALYLIGYFEVALAGMAADFDEETLCNHFATNFHVRHPTLYERQKHELVLVKGGPGSRLFRRAYQISAEGRDRSSKPLKVLAPDMQKVFGDFAGHVSIQRSPPRWVAIERVQAAVAYLKKLE